MSVPNSANFNLQDVVTELGGGETSLRECFTNANVSRFDPAYNNDTYAPVNSMLRFRNYKDESIVLTPSIISITRNDGKAIFRILFTASEPMPISLDYGDHIFTITNMNGAGVVGNFGFPMYADAISYTGAFAADAEAITGAFTATLTMTPSASYDIGSPLVLEVPAI